MPLFSQLLKGDQRLQACLTDDASHVLKGATGPFVEKIQSALVIVDDAVINGFEMRSKYYGDSTSRAVLAYKQRRNIINHSYQTQADAIVGKMTIAALDREVLQYEHAATASNACAGKRPPRVIV